MRPAPTRGSLYHMYDNSTPPNTTTLVGGETLKATWTDTSGTPYTSLFQVPGGPTGTAFGEIVVSGTASDGKDPGIGSGLVSVVGTPLRFRQRPAPPGMVLRPMVRSPLLVFLAYSTPATAFASTAAGLVAALNAASPAM